MMAANELLHIQVSEVMTTDLIKVKQDTILKEVKILFDKHNIHHIPVINDQGKFVGIISKTDINLLMDWGTKLELPSSLRRNTFLLTSNLAKDIMESNVMKLKPNDTLNRCVQIFRENYFRALPIVNDNDELEGIITTYDLMILAYSKPNN